MNLQCRRHVWPAWAIQHKVSWTWGLCIATKEKTKANGIVFCSYSRTAVSARYTMLEPALSLVLLPGVVVVACKLWCCLQVKCTGYFNQAMRRRWMWIRARKHLGPLCLLAMVLNSQKKQKMHKDAQRDGSNETTNQETLG